jgi:hypothetical protein
LRSEIWVANRGDGRPKSLEKCNLDNHPGLFDSYWVVLNHFMPP